MLYLAFNYFSWNPNLCRKVWPYSQLYNYSKLLFQHYCFGVSQILGPLNCWPSMSLSSVSCLWIMGRHMLLLFEATLGAHEATLKLWPCLHLYFIRFSVIGGLFIIAGLYLVTWARYNEAQRVLAADYLRPLLVEEPPNTKTEGSSFSGSIDP